MCSTGASTSWRQRCEAVALFMPRPPSWIEPSDGIEDCLVTRSKGSLQAVTATSNIELTGEPEYDSVLDCYMDGVKEEVKCQEEKPENDKYSSANSRSDGKKPNARAGQGGEPVVESNFNRKGLGSSREGKNCDGSRKQDKRKIPRNKAAKKRKEHKCHVCGYVTSYKCNLKSHMQAKHTGEKQFKCGICGKRLIEKGHLNQHLATHGDKFPFRCTKFRRGFLNGDDKTVHEKICRHRQYQCYMCEYSSLNTTKLRNHMRKAIPLQVVQSTVFPQ
ncbi:zinc finger protein 260-like, partial [Sitodiplosis mosellana]|uniref:zinc finger protein 260-like n=1 Tax=Sitodiplosis mosellana TaxID=263140 RepID=UPI002443FDCD